MSGKVLKAIVAEIEADNISEISIPDETTEENYNLYAGNDTPIDKKCNEPTHNGTSKATEKGGPNLTSEFKAKNESTLARDNLKKHSKTLKGIRIRKSKDSLGISEPSNSCNEADELHDLRNEIRKFRTSVSTADTQHGDRVATGVNFKSKKENEETVDSFSGDCKQQSCIRRAVKGQCRKPVYDAMNTSTSMILLNNKYGKMSRLWTSDTNDVHTNRRQLIDPDRHTREATIYLRGGFHIRCATSKSPDRFRSTVKPNLDFVDRPHSDRIGDRLYEARLSVNPHRHRRCTTSSCKMADSFDLSSRKGVDPKLYMFPWERIYSQPLTRPSTRHTSRLVTTSAHPVTRVSWGASHASIKTAF